MAGTLKVGGKVLATHNSETDEVSLDSATNTSNMSFDANHAGIKTALNASGNPGIYACRAWVNFNGIGTVAIRDSGNVSSVSDISQGRYAIAFAQNMPHTDYAVSGITQRSVSYTTNLNPIVMGIRAEPGAGLSNSGFEITTHFTTNASQEDPIVVCISVFC